MANDFKKPIQEIQSELLSIEKQLAINLKQVLDISKAARDLSTSFKDIKTPSGVNRQLKETTDNTEQLNAVLKEQDRLEKSLISTQAKQKLSTESTNKARIQATYELQQQNKLVKEATVISSRYSTQLQKSTAIRNKLARTIQDLNLKKELGNKLSDKEQKELKQSTKEFNKYDNAIKKAKNSVGRFQENVGNYPKILGGITSLTTGLIGSFGVLEGLRLSFDFASEAVQLAREAKGVEFAFERLGYKGVKAFEDIKGATKGTISDLEIKKSLTEFKNLGISLEASGVAFEFLAVRAAQTGRSVKSMREDLVTGLGRGSVRILDNLGLSMAELNKLTKEQGLTTQEAFGVIARQEIEKAGNILDEATSSQEKFNAAFENFKVSAGSGFLGKLTNDFYTFNTALLESIGDINEASDGFLDLISNAFKFAQGQGSLVAAEAAINREMKKRIPLVDEILKTEKEQGVISLQLALNKEKYLKTNSKELALLLESLSPKKEDIDLDEKKREAMESINKESILSIKLEKERNKDLKIAKDTLEALKELYKDVDLFDFRAKKNNETIFDYMIAKQKDYEDKINKSESFKLPEIDQQSIDEMRQKMDEAFTINAVTELNKEILDEAFNDLAETIEQFTGVSGDKIINFFDKVRDKGIDSFEDIADVAEASFDVIGEISGAFFQNRIDAYELDIERNNEYYSNLLNNETLTDAEMIRLEKDRENREKELRKKQAKEKEKQAKVEKAMAIAKIILNTAQGVSAALPNIPLAVLVGALGAAELVTAIATPIPKFAEGGEMDHDGAMMINDHSSGRLEVVERDGKLLMTNKRNAIVEGKKGDIIHKDANEYFSKLSDDEIANNLQNHSILASLQHNNYLANKLSDKIIVDNQKIHTDRIVAAIKRSTPKINVVNNNNIGDQLAYQLRGDF